MAVAFFFSLNWMGTSFLLTNNQWSVDPALFVTYFVFFGQGGCYIKQIAYKTLNNIPSYN